MHLEYSELQSGCNLCLGQPLSHVSKMRIDEIYNVTVIVFEVKIITFVLILKKVKSFVGSNSLNIVLA